MQAIRKWKLGSRECIEIRVSSHQNKTYFSCLISPYEIPSVLSSRKLYPCGSQSVKVLKFDFEFSLLILIVSMKGHSTNK